MLNQVMGAASASRIVGCGPWRPGAARGLELASPGNDQAAAFGLELASADGVAPGALLCCVPTPPAVICVGLNYRKHAAEAGLPEPAFPVVFYKNPSVVIGPGDDIVIPTVASDPHEVDYECELAVVIGSRPVRNVSKADALDYVLGYTAANDVSARRWQGPKGGTQWSRSKSFDTFCPLGPALLLAHSDVDPDNLAIATRLNGVTVQESNTADMIFDVSSIVSFLSQSTTLLPGTVILTGTPEGVGFTREPPVFLKPGDVVEVELEGVGILSNSVVEEGEDGPPKQVWSHSLNKLVDP